MSEPRIQYRKLRAPQQHDSVLMDPPLSDSQRLLENNLSLIQQSDNLQIFGMTLAELRVTGRKALQTAALKYTGGYTNCNNKINGERIFLSGHQPKLFHPGVWFKNILLAELAKKHSATAINLIIDNDLCGQHSIKVPQGTIETPIVCPVFFDRNGDNVPFEEVVIQDQSLFESFGQRVANSVIPEAGDNIRQFWELVSRSQSNNPGLKFSQARHQWEREYGIENLELPLSTVCSSREFYRFCCHLLQNAENLQTIYNASLVEYRKVHKIRSTSHPVPALECINNAVEVPLWIWSKRSPSRKRLFCITSGDETTLLDESGLTYGTINLASDKESAINQLALLAQSGIKIRPRALTTTMYCRLVLSDLFVHGIGGGKYDQLTDEITKQFFKSPLPHFQIATATVKLFADQLANPMDALQTIEKDLRDLQFSPDKFARKAINNVHSNSLALEKLIDKKLKHVQQEVAPADRSGWHTTLQGIHQQLRTLLAKDEEELKATKEMTQDRLKSFELLDSREYSLILFNGKTLLDLLVSGTKTP